MQRLFNEQTKAFLVGYVTSIVTGISTLYIFQKYVVEKAAANAIVKYEQKKEAAATTIPVTTTETTTTKTTKTTLPKAKVIKKQDMSMANWKPLSLEQLEKISEINRLL